MNLNKIINDIINAEEIRITDLICICGNKDLFHYNSYKTFNVYICNKCNKQLKQIKQGSSNNGNN